MASVVITLALFGAFVALIGEEGDPPFARCFVSSPPVYLTHRRPLRRYAPEHRPGGEDSPRNSGRGLTHNKIIRLRH